MGRLKLSASQRRLRLQLQTASDARLYRRTLAVLELDRGRSAADIADMLGVTRQSVHNWAAAYARQSDPTALSDGHRRGRPRLLTEDTEDLLRLLLACSPQDLGHPGADWTVPLLRRELGPGDGRGPSDDTVRRGLHRLGYVWKRPRYVLDPDPEREKKTADPPADPGPPAAERRSGRGRDRPDDVPAAAGRVVAEGWAGGGPHQRPERPAGDLRHDEPGDRDTAPAASARGAGR